MFSYQLLFRLLACSMLLTTMLFPSPACAEIKEIIAEGSYIMGDGETPAVAQERAIVEAKRMAVEQAGTYLESFTEVKNMHLSKDQIRVFASGVTETTVIDKRRTLGNNDSIVFWIQVKCLVNTDNMQVMRNKLQNNTAMDTLREVQSDYEKARQEINDLKRQLAEATTLQEKQQVEQRIVQNEQSFSATQWFDKGYDYQVNKNDYPNAILAYNNAIQLNPHDTNAYYNRGVAYHDLGQSDLALSDYTKAIGLNPLDPDFFYNRGNVYRENEQYSLAISDYTKAIQLNPQYTNAYINRGIAYRKSGQYYLSITDYNKAAQQTPGDPDVYYNRGISYGDLGQYDVAIRDYNKVIQLDPQYANAYYNRGLAYHDLGQYDMAIFDYTKAIEINPLDPDFYFNRGNTYDNVSQFKLALQDYNDSIQLNPHFANAYYNKALVCKKLGRNSEALQAYRLFLQYAPSTDPDIERARQNIRELSGSF